MFSVWAHITCHCVTKKEFKLLDKSCAVFTASLAKRPASHLIALCRSSPLGVEKHIGKPPSHRNKQSKLHHLSLGVVGCQTLKVYWVVGTSADTPLKTSWNLFFPSLSFATNAASASSGSGLSGLAKYIIHKWSLGQQKESRKFLQFKIKRQLCLWYQPWILYCMCTTLEWRFLQWCNRGVQCSMTS